MLSSTLRNVAGRGACCRNATELSCVALCRNRWYVIVQGWRVEQELVQLEVYLTAGASSAPVAARQHLFTLHMWRVFCLPTLS